MHCFERTLWLFFCVCLTGNVLCQAAPPEGHLTEKSLNGSAQESGRQGTNVNDDHDDLHSYPVVPSSPPPPPPPSPLQLEAASVTYSKNMPNPESTNYRAIANVGPGNYLETRRRQTESRIQRLETQLNVLLEAQKEMTDSKPDPEADLKIAIQHGLNCERGDAVLVCLMKKVVILRREMSGIRRDVSELNKKVVHLETEDKKEGKVGTTNKEKEDEKDARKRDPGPENRPDRERESLSPGNGNATTTDSPLETLLPQHDPLCPPGFERVGNVCYYVVTDRTGGVGSSRDFCRNHGGFLARPRDSLTIHDLANHLTSIHETVSELWVDGQYETKEKTWRWNNGERIDSSIWGISDTPSKSHGTGTCVLLKKELNYLAMPQDCGYHYFFVCEAETKKKEP